MSSLSRNLDQNPIEGTAARPEPFGQPFIPPAIKPGGPADPPRFDFQVVRSVRMRPRLAAGVALAICLLLVVLALRSPVVYSAQSEVFVEPNLPKSLNDLYPPSYDQYRYASYVDQQLRTVVRPDILTTALRSLPAGTWRLPRESEQQAVKRLAKSLVVERIVDSYSISIKLNAAKADEAAAVVNAVTQAYLQGGRRDETTQADSRAQLLAEERQRIHDELEQDRKEQAQLGTTVGMANPASAAANPFDADLANLRLQVATARQAHDVAAAQLNSVSGASPDQRSGLLAQADEALNADPGLGATRSSVNARRAVLKGLMAGLTPNNPQYKQDQDEIADLDRLLETETAQARQRAEIRIQDKLRTELQRTDEVQSQLNAQLAQATARATGAGPRLQRAADLENDIQRLTARYAKVDEALQSLQIDTNGPGMAHLVLAATPAAAPEGNRRGLLLMAALPLGLCFGVFAAVVARARDHRVYIGADLQRAMGFPPIAVLPARADVSSPVFDEYVLRLAAGVESAYRRAEAKTFILTAVSPAAEIGPLIQALARRLEEMRLDVRVLPASELLSASRQTAEHSTALQHVSGERARAPHPREGIASVRLDRMKSEHDVVLIDAAPLLHSAESEYAARCADATILVARSGVTLSTELIDAATLLFRLRVTGVAAVLEEVHLQQANEAFRTSIQVVEQRYLGERADPPGVETAESPALPDELEKPHAVTSAHEIHRPRRDSSIEETSQSTASDAIDGEAYADLPPRTRDFYAEAGPEIPMATDPHVVSPASMAADEQSNLATPSQEAPKAAAAAEPEPSQLQEAGIEPAGWSQSETVAFQEAIEDLSLTQAAPIPPALPVAEISQTDEAAEAEPSYTRPTATRPTTRSRARGKETEVNAKTDWFSKLFRGDSQAAYRVVPEDDDRSDAQALPGTARDKPQAELQTESHTVESAAEAHAAPVEQVRVQETSASMPSTENSPGFVAETPETPAAAISAAESELRVADGGEALDIDPQAAKIQTASPHQAFENTLHPLTTEQVPAPAQHLELSERAAGGVTDQPEPPLALALDPSIHEAPKHGDSASEPLATVLPLQEQRPAAGLESLPSFPDAPPLRRVVDPARRRGPATWQQQTVDNPAALVAAGADLLPGGRGREGLSRSRLPNSSASAARGASAQRRAFAAGRAIEEPRAHQAAPSQQEGDGPAAAGSLSRRWRLLSHFEPTVADPAAQRSDEG